ncbi:hypothetical protein EBZ80_27230 [bacterium]|nr:hypothetical protein [bacterium]
MLGHQVCQDSLLLVMVQIDLLTRQMELFGRVQQVVMQFSQVMVWQLVGAHLYHVLLRWVMEQTQLLTRQMVLVGQLLLVVMQ